MGPRGLESGRQRGSIDFVNPVLDGQLLDKDTPYA
jgi:hypothetical protein